MLLNPRAVCQVSEKQDDRKSEWPPRPLPHHTRRNVPGRKTDLQDCQWIAGLHEHGLLRPGVIPAAEVAALRARTRYRKKLIEQRTSEGPRLSKTLEDGGIKIDSVASELLGKSGRDMIEALITGERNPGVLADLARGVLRRKIDDLQMACDGRFTESRAPMCRLQLDVCDHLTAKIGELGQLVPETAAPFAALIARLVTIPGIGQPTAQVIVAETGGDMSRFRAAARRGGCTAGMSGGFRGQPATARPPISSLPEQATTRRQADSLQLRD